MPKTQPEEISLDDVEEYDTLTLHVKLKDGRRGTVTLTESFYPVGWSDRHITFEAVYHPAENLFVEDDPCTA